MCRRVRLTVIATATHQPALYNQSQNRKKKKKIWIILLLLLQRKFHFIGHKQATNRTRPSHRHVYVCGFPLFVSPARRRPQAARPTQTHMTGAHGPQRHTATKENNHSNNNNNIKAESKQQKQKTTTTKYILEKIGCGAHGRLVDWQLRAHSDHKISVSVVAFCVWLPLSASSCSVCVCLR